MRNPFFDVYKNVWYNESCRVYTGFKEKIMKQKIMLLLKSFLTTVAITTEFGTVLQPEFYETKIDYIIASIYELLGNYNVEFLFVWMLSAVFFGMLGKKAVFKDSAKRNTSVFLAGFFALCLVVGKSYHETASAVYIFGSVVNFLKAAGAIAGYACLFYLLIALAFEGLKNVQFCGENQGFWAKKAFWKSFLILSAVYGVVVLISYPGTLCWDVIGQIEQVTKEIGYSAHHPLLHTLLVGGLTELGHILFGSYEIGLFVYMFVQLFLFTAALAATVSVLAKRGLKKEWLTALVVLYCVTPLYSNIVSVAIKDVPFCAFVIGYFICFVMLLEKPEKIKDTKFLVCYILLQLGVILFRNNGLPLVVLSGLGAFIYFFKKYNWKERIVYLTSAFLLSVAVSKLIVFVLMQLTSATEGSSGEILSIPFQQTARYLQLYQNEIDEGEREAIEAVLGPVSTVAAQYNPAISDDVKKLFDKEATTEEILDYMLVWAKGFFKHPGVYFDAFFTHIYGWFTPGVSNAIRYETPYTDIAQQGLFKDAQKYLIFLYRFANRIPVLGILENVGAYVWGMFFFMFYAKKNKKKEFLYAGIPLIISLLICMASPCFITHPRYGMPIMTTLPFLYGFMLSKKEGNA